MIEGKRLFNLPEEKPAFSAFFVTLDISEFLGTETIQTVSFSAVRESTGENVSTVVLDQARCTFSGYNITPWIRAGTPGATYLLEIKVTTVQGTKEVFWIRFDVIDYYSLFASPVSLDAILYTA